MTRPGIGQNMSCTVGDLIIAIASRPAFFPGKCSSVILHLLRHESQLVQLHAMRLQLSTIDMHAGDDVYMLAVQVKLKLYVT